MTGDRVSDVRGASAAVGDGFELVVRGHREDAAQVDLHGEWGSAVAPTGSGGFTGLDDVLEDRSQSVGPPPDVTVRAV